jgi:hypothetical protein
MAMNVEMKEIRYNEDTFTYAHHILTSGHIYRNINNTTETTGIAMKYRFLKSLEKYYIYRA